MTPFLLLLVSFGAPPTKAEMPVPFEKLFNPAPPYKPEVPLLFRWKSFTCVTLAETVNHYVALGEEEAVKELEYLCSDWLTERHADCSRRERIGWVCRMLFQPTGKEPLRPPAYGMLSLPYISMPLTRWPLYPVTASGTSYFVLSEGHLLAGQAELPGDYLAYCRINGSFRTEKVPVPTREQALEDLEKLRRSPAWKAIKWSDGNEWGWYMFDERGTWRYIKAQAEGIPAW
jgi:hypothetical protein